MVDGGRGGERGPGARNESLGCLCVGESVCARVCATACVDVPTQPSYQEAASVWHVGKAIAPLLCWRKKKRAAEPSESEFSHRDGKGWRKGEGCVGEGSSTWKYKARSWQHWGTMEGEMGGGVERIARTQRHKHTQYPNANTTAAQCIQD